MKKPVESAIWYLKTMQWYCIPVNMETKAAYIKYAQWNDDPDDAKKFITEAQIATWWGQWPDAGLGCLLVPSGLTVIDYDTYNPKYAKDEIREKVPMNEATAFSITPHHGMHFFYNRVPELPHKAGILPGLDLRNQSYIPLPPSRNGIGPYEWSLFTKDYLHNNKRFPLLDLNLSLIESVQELYKSQVNLQKYPDVSKGLQTFNKGTRDDDLFHIANLMIKGGGNPSETNQVLEIIARNCNPPYPENEVKFKVKSAIDRASRRDRNIADEVRKWVEVSTGIFQVSELLRESLIVSKPEKHAVILELAKLCKAGVIEKFGDKRGSYRVADKDCDDIDVINVNENDILDIKWPFGIESYFRTFPKNIIMVAGEGDSGKSAFLMNFAKMNMNNYKTHYFSSEMGAMELRDRLSKFDDMNFTDWAKVSFKERAGNFADVIDPDGINIIDFLELHDNFYIVGGLIKAIFDKLKFGIAVIALQKPRGRDEGIGGEKSKEKARLYLSMSPGLIKITKAKNWANSRINPNGLLKKFSLVHGCKFIEQSTWELEIDEKYKEFK